MEDKLLRNYLGVLATGLSDLIVDQTKLSASAQAILLTLKHWAPLPASELAAIVQLSQPATTRALEKLREQSLVAWRSEGRVRPVSLTKPGQKAALELEQNRDQKLASMLAPLSATEARQLTALLAKMLAGPKRSRSCARYTCRFCNHQICDGAKCPVGQSVPDV